MVLSSERSLNYRAPGVKQEELQTAGSDKSPAQTEMLEVQRIAGGGVNSNSLYMPAVPASSGEDMQNTVSF